MKELMSAENLTEAVTTIKALNEKLVTLQKDLALWKITFSVDVENTNNSFYAVITARVGDRGVRKFVNEQDLIVFADDPSTLIKEISKEILLALLLDEATTSLTSVLVPAIANVNKLANKKGFSK